jgi:mannose-6-phosphate isomerase-like protein (cupin superfamily)
MAGGCLEMTVLPHVIAGPADTPLPHELQAGRARIHGDASDDADGDRIGLVAGRAVHDQGSPRDNGRRARPDRGGLLGRDGHPLHLHHHEDEAFYILDGQIRFRRGDEVFTAKPGEFVFGPREVPHCYKVLDGGARALVLITPAGLEHMSLTQGCRWSTRPSRRRATTTSTM